MSRYEECNQCGKMTYRTWQEKHEFWGSITYEPMGECENEHCGEPECNNCGEYENLKDGLCESCQEEEK